jgi:cytochrome c
MIRAALVVAALLPLAAQAGDAAKGRIVFQRCAICHRVEKDGGNGLGPNLFGIAGRKAATGVGFNYSAALKSSGIIWTQDKLKQWVAHPSALVPGNRMAFAGLMQADQQADVAAYLATLK